MERKQINLALQGGGAHGAFAWGVLDRLLDEDWLDIAAVSGTSAGALNAAALKAGLSVGAGGRGRQAARENLDAVWSAVGEVSENRIIRWMASLFPVPRGFQRVTEMFSPIAWLEGVTRVFSPYDYGPFYTNPLTEIIGTIPHGDFTADGGPDLFISATNVRTGRVRVFTGADLSLKAVLASACLPTLFRAIEIDDPKSGLREAYWDGGYSANPALFPLFAQGLPRDIVIVNINPWHRDDLPRTPVDIQNRINEISFNASLQRELRAINFVKRLFDQGRLEEGSMKNVLVHMIYDDHLMTDLSARTKLMPGPGLLSRMKAAGQDAADRWLANNAGALGQRDTVDLPSLFG